MGKKREIRLEPNARVEPIIFGRAKVWLDSSQKNPKSAKITFEK